MDVKNLLIEAQKNEKAGKIEEAIELYTKIINEFPDTSEADLARAYRYNLVVPADKEHDELFNIPFISSDVFTEETIIKTHGMARGSTVRAKHIGKDLMAEIKNIVGGELKGYTELLAEGREEAIYRMKQDAVRLGANAITCVRFTTSTVTMGAAEILAYGTAVTIEIKNDL